MSPYSRRCLSTTRKSNRDPTRISCEITHFRIFFFIVVVVFLSFPFPPRLTNTSSRLSSNISASRSAHVVFLTAGSATQRHDSANSDYHLTKISRCPRSDSSGKKHVAESTRPHIPTLSLPLLDHIRNTERFQLFFFSIRRSGSGHPSDLRDKIFHTFWHSYDMETR